MENRRGRLCVINRPATHRQMEGASSPPTPDWASRFTVRVDFPGYSPDELLTIVRSMAAGRGSTSWIPARKQGSVLVRGTAGGESRQLRQRGAPPAGCCGRMESG